MSIWKKYHRLDLQWTVSKICMWLGSSRQNHCTYC